MYDFNCNSEFNLYIFFLILVIFVPRFNIIETFHNNCDVNFQIISLSLVINWYIPKNNCVLIKKN